MIAFWRWWRNWIFEVEYVVSKWLSSMLLPWTKTVISWEMFDSWRVTDILSSRDGFLRLILANGWFFSLINGRQHSHGVRIPTLAWQVVYEYRLLTVYYNRWSILHYFLHLFGNRLLFQLWRIRLNLQIYVTFLWDLFRGKCQLFLISVMIFISFNFRSW